MTAPDYETLLDAEIHAYLAYNASFMPDDPSLENIRAAYLAFCEAIQPELPDVAFIDAHVGGVPTRRYHGKAPDALVVYFHGGGFAIGNLESHHAICMEICARTGLDVLAVDYRLAPEHPWPAHFDDALAVVDALDEKIILAGDSAGATLAAAVTLKRREKVHGHMLIYPWLDVPEEHESFREHANAPILTAEALQDFEATRLSGQARPKTPDYFPLLGDDFNALPPSYISVAECDPLHDEGVLYNTLHMFSGGESVLMEEEGLMHGHLHARHHSARAMAAFAHICEGINNLSAWEKPSF
jgi:acetyl esterase